MNENEQVEEMAEELIDIQRDFNEYCAKPCRECELGGIVNCENHYKAKALYSKGYRKVGQGKWEDNADGTHWCSECGHDATYTYDGIEVCGVCCPFCGADMRGAEE